MACGLIRGLLKTLSYCEGDVYLVVCPDTEHYNAEIKAACEFHGEGFEMIACDMDVGKACCSAASPKARPRSIARIAASSLFRQRNWRNEQSLCGFSKRGWRTTCLAAKAAGSGSPFFLPLPLET